MKNIIFIIILLIYSSLQSQIVLKPDQVFDGITVHKDWIVIVQGNKIDYVGPENKTSIPANSTIILLKGKTLMPGIIEGHSHLLLHPYNETSWNDQVLKESPTERAIRGTVHAKNSLMAGITFMKDMGSEGAGYSDVYLKKMIDEGIIVGPRVMVSGPAIVATGAYGPKGFYDGVHVPLGAEEASGNDEVIKTVRRQIGNGVDFIKIYADYRWRNGEPSQPTFSLEEIKTIVATANSAGRHVAAHAGTPEGMRRAIMGGVETIEHGDGGTLEIFKLMKEKGVALCPTLEAGYAIEQYNGWKKELGPEPERITKKKESFKLALEAGVEIIFGGDVGVFTHGENYKELELMVEYGMKPIDALRSATAINARIFHLKTLGQIKKDFLADIIAVEGNPIENIRTMKAVTFVMKDGFIYKNN
ncbi:MAG: amidohydrolase family protein [Lutibacter sp.]